MASRETASDYISQKYHMVIMTTKMKGELIDYQSAGPTINAAVSDQDIDQN